MSTITVALPKERLVKLNEMARQLGVVPGELLTRPEANPEQAVDYVVRKNAELYRRLA
jgi:hypothetical protein